MSELSRQPSTPPVIPVVTLAQIPELAQQLTARVHQSGFEPQLIVYVETGARLLAHEMGSTLGVPLVPIWVRRGGRSMKEKLASLAACLPVPVRDWLRRTEERSGLHRLTSRTVYAPDHVTLTATRVLLLDDAADTGRTIAVARETLRARGVSPDALRTAVLAATTPAAQSAVDFFVLNRNCRMPWSADSEERDEAHRRAARLTPLHAPRNF